MGRGGLLLIPCLLLLEGSPGLAMKIHANDQVKAEETAARITSQSPPEDNTTWCVALESAAQIDLQNALDWVCGIGGADCRVIQKGGNCFQPDTLVSHASYAFNLYYQQNGRSYVACNFGGTAVVTSANPSYDKCIYTTFGPKSRNHSSALSPFSLYRPNLTWWTTPGLLILLYSTR